MRKKSTKRSKRSNKKSNENMKYEIANELGVSLGGKTASNANGRVGGEMTKRLVSEGNYKMNGSSKKSS